MPYEKNGTQRPCKENCKVCGDTSCENYFVPLTKPNETEPKASDVSKENQENEKVESYKPTYEENLERFVSERVNEIVNSYYKLAYDNRKLVKYIYNERYNNGYFINEKDRFYISGPISTKNLDTRWDDLAPEKKSSIKLFIDQIELYNVADVLGMFYLDEDSTLFSTNSSAHVDKRVICDKSSGKRVYSLPKKHIDAKVYEKDEIKQAYKSFLENKIKERNSNNN